MFSSRSGSVGGGSALLHRLPTVRKQRGRRRRRRRRVNRRGEEEEVVKVAKEKQYGLPTDCQQIEVTDLFSR